MSHKKKMSVLVYVCYCTGFLLIKREKIALGILWLSKCFVTLWGTEIPIVPQFNAYFMCSKR